MKVRGSQEPITPCSPPSTDEMSQQLLISTSSLKLSVILSLNTVNVSDTLNMNIFSVCSLSLDLLYKEDRIRVSGGLLTI